VARSVQHQPRDRSDRRSARALRLGSDVERRQRRTNAPGDLVAQFKLAWKNLVDVLAAAHMEPKNIVRLNFYTTDVDAFMAKAGEMVPIFAQTGCKPASTLLGVTRLFEPSIMLEIEATAVA
jgi:enamine deaminase RidA (YjgF/YER057c/UK114 family)